jgi:plasmid stabilization system protein ParE
MEEGLPYKPYVVSWEFNESRKQIYEYSLETFGYFQAERYRMKIRKSLDTLSCYYTYYPECRHIPTKSRMYRNIILDAHLIIYRITNERIEVLNIIHSASSINKIRRVRKVRL